MLWPLPDGWPLSDHSRRVSLGPTDWHIQELGQGDTLLLLHGAGGSTQSWRNLAPRLAITHHVVAIDLPGQGASTAHWGTRFGLDDMAKAIFQLCSQQGWRPVAIIGHSAGGALALRLAEAGLFAPVSPRGQVIGINAALGTFKGLAGVMFPIAAKMLAANPLAARFLAGRAQDAKTIRQILSSTGSDIGDRGVALYQTLASDPDHVSGTLRMMAAWQLDGLIARFMQNDVPTTLLVGDRDGTVPPETSRRAAARLPHGTVVELSGLGHLAHEEDAARVSESILAVLESRAAAE